MTLNPRTVSASRRLARVVAVALLACGLSTVLAGPATAADEVGYVRLAHLSPDTPPVDVYLTAVTGSMPPKKFDAVPYGVVSPYLPLPAGTYAVAMRNVGAAGDSPPVLSTQVTVNTGSAYTVAGVGKFADLGLRVYNDDLKLPASGKAKVRVIQASVASPLLDVSVANGETIANGVAFATTTDYREVNSGKWTLKLQPQGSTAATTVSASLAAGGVYSLLVLDGKDKKLTVEVRTDALGGSVVPQGGVDTGRGGTVPMRRESVLIGAGMVALFAMVMIGLRPRRRGAHRRA